MKREINLFRDVGTMEIAKQLNTDLRRKNNENICKIRTKLKNSFKNA